LCGAGLWVIPLPGLRLTHTSNAVSHDFLTAKVIFVSGTISEEEQKNSGNFAPNQLHVSNELP
jgi:hypothetical protein